MIHETKAEGNGHLEADAAAVKIIAGPASEAGARWRKELTSARTPAQLADDNLLIGDALALAGAIGLGVAIERVPLPPGSDEVTDPHRPARYGGVVIPVEAGAGGRRIAWHLTTTLAYGALDVALGAAPWNALPEEAQEIAAIAFWAGWYQGRAL